LEIEKETEKERKVVIGIEWASNFYNDRLTNAKIEIETGRERKRLN
jgi:hypothetical protein